MGVQVPLGVLKETNSKSLEIATATVCGFDSLMDRPNKVRHW